MLLVFIILCLFSWVENFNYSSESIRHNDKLLSGDRQTQEHLCIFGCIFIIPFGEPFILPSNCRRELTLNACEIDLQVDFKSNDTVFSFANETIDLIIDDTHLDTVLAEVIGFIFHTNEIIYTLAYKCSYGNECEWNYINEKLPDIINKGYRPLYNSLSPFLYHENFDSTNIHCYSLDELSQCESGVCDFTETLDHDNFTIIRSRQCVIFDYTSKLYFGQYRHTPGPTKYDFDYLHFGCNINECNSPANELIIKDLIKSAIGKNLSSIKSEYSYMFYFIILFIINCFTY